MTSAPNLASTDNPAATPCPTSLRKPLRHGRSLYTLARRLVAPAVVLIATRVFAQAAPSVPAASPPAPPAHAPGATPATSQPAQLAKADPFMRVADDKNKSVELQIATRDYAPIDGKGPRVGLVGVAHIGDKSFYRGVQKLLENYDVVLYESVKPAGTAKPGGDTPEQRAQSTKASMRFVGGLIETYHHKQNAYPANLDALKKFAQEQDPRLAQFLAVAMVDAWGTPLRYESKPAAAPEGQPTYVLTSLGADHAAGGEGENTDLALDDENPPDPLALSKDDGLQTQLADALGLEFQLTALDYGRANWRCSDMAMDELNRRLQAKGLDFEMIGGTLAGSSLPAKVIKFLLGFMKLADSFMSGAITDTFKVVMIEMLGDPALTDMSLDQLGAGFGEVIINDRNQVPLGDLKQIIAHEPDIKSVAILYGAGHMNTMDKQLREQMGYAPIESGDHWLTAIKVDLAQSAVSPRELAQIRTMIHQAIKQQMKRGS